MANHNKKRNVGLVYEFFARYIGSAVIEGRNEDIAKAKKIIRKHFGKETELHKELKLFKALHEGTAQTREAAVYQLNRIRDMVRVQNGKALDAEKSSLILEINSLLAEPEFFNAPVTDYKTYASIQILFNAWRSGMVNENISEILNLESKMIDNLCENNKRTNKEKLNAVLDMPVEEVDNAVVALMTEKINKRFANELNDEQRSIIQHYVFRDSSEVHASKLTESLSALKDRMLKTLNKVKVEFAGDRLVKEKIVEVTSLLESKFSEIQNPDDETITFYLSLPALEMELINV